MEQKILDICNELDENPEWEKEHDEIEMRILEGVGKLMELKNIDEETAMKVMIEDVRLISINW
tara:strand:+ start:7548 stop:7736 length:189 start_codon:yes stop_codon:yes gene_type:complete